MAESSPACRVEWPRRSPAAPAGTKTGGARRHLTKEPMNTGYHACLLLPPNLLHRLSLGELIDQLVEIANFLHHGIVEFFHTPAHTTPLMRELFGCLSGACAKKVSKSLCWSICFCNPAGSYPRQPANDSVYFRLRAVLPLRLLNVHRIHPRKGCSENAMLCHGHPAHASGPDGSVVFSALAASRCRAIPSFRQFSTSPSSQASRSGLGRT